MKQYKLLGLLMIILVIISSSCINQTKKRTDIQLTEQQLKKYVGVYQFVESPGTRKISLIKGKLFYEKPSIKSEDPWSQRQIFPESIYDFFAEGKGSTITFQFDENKDVVGFTINQFFVRTIRLKKIE